MEDLLTGIKEVQEGGKRLANWYLERGYILLAIQLGARALPFPNQNVGGQQYYVRRNPVFVLGRPEGVKPAPHPPKVVLSKAESKGGEETAASEEK
jgi:hypothetical protein